MSQGIEGVSDQPGFRLRQETGAAALGSMNGISFSIQVLVAG